MLGPLLSLVLTAAAPVEVAVTIDDLPFVSDVGPKDSPQAATDRLLAAAKAQRAPVTGFVICGRGPSEVVFSDILARWRRAGAELGNHTTRHKSVDQLDLDQWMDDVRSCDAQLARELKTPVRYFRYPYLQQGRTAQKRDAAAAALSKMGYQVGQVSIDTSDWALVVPYVKALHQGDKQVAQSIGRAFVEHVVAAARHYRDEARSQVGRDIKHILLLHAHALSADWLGQALAALSAEGFQFISLEDALQDPIYQLPEQYTGAIGLSWLYRIAPDAARRWRWDDSQTKLLRLRYPE